MDGPRSYPCKPRPRDRPRTMLPAASRPLPWARRRPSRAGKPASSSRPLRGAPRNRPGLLRAARLQPGGPRPGVLGVGLAGRRVSTGRQLGPQSSGSAPALGSAVGRGEGARHAGRVWSAGRVHALGPAGRLWRRPRGRGLPTGGCEREPDGPPPAASGAASSATSPPFELRRRTWRSSGVSAPRRPRDAGASDARAIKLHYDKQ